MKIPTRIYWSTPGARISARGSGGCCYDFTPDVEQTSIDEGDFDLTANHKKPAVEIALTIRGAIGQKLIFSVSDVKHSRAAEDKLQATGFVPKGSLIEGLKATVASFVKKMA